LRPDVRIETCPCEHVNKASLPGGAQERGRLGLALPEPQPFHERHALLLSASPSMVGGNRGIWALRVPFEHLGARIYADMFSLAQAHIAFDEDGHIANKELRRRFETTIVNFMDLVEASKHYRRVKSLWVEYPGEHPEPALDRVQ